MYTHIEVESNDNCPMSANQVFKNLADPFRVAQVRIFEGGAESTLCAITGWTSDPGRPLVEAFAVEVEDSGSGAAWLVYGGDYGLRLKAADADQEWDLTDPTQWGETHLVLADASDLIAAES